MSRRWLDGRACWRTSRTSPWATRSAVLGYLEGSGKMILSEPQPLLTKASKMPGLDGQKMSKSYGNTIALREDAGQVSKKIRTMPTDPARVRAPIRRSGQVPGLAIASSVFR
jgi:tryptophanyl-tRNA synthetase